jgi:two-component system sensor histidine kinase UhpB
VAVVALGAVAGTLITVWHVRLHPTDLQIELIGLFVASGVAISYAVNAWVLKQALAPLHRLQAGVDAVRSGQQHVHVAAGAAADQQFERLAATFNQMVAQLEADARQRQLLSRLILQAQEEERQRLARELHDEAAQSLTSLLVHLRLLERAQNPADAQQRVQELRELTAQALEDVRRVALDLRPTILDDLGLGPALEWRVDELNKQAGVHGAIRIGGLDRRLAAPVELALYRVAQEALANVVRHAQATAVAVSLQRSAAGVELEIADDGVGFDVRGVQHAAAHRLGLVGMCERVEALGGELIIAAEAGRGTRVTARLPLPAEGQRP